LNSSPTKKAPQQQDQIDSFKVLIQDQLHYSKSKIDLLMSKVDSMDNTYDKRLSNLEAVVTPLLQEKLNHNAVQSQI
jgi:hypothetical protein